MVDFALEVRAHMHAFPRLVLVCGFSGAANAFINLGAGVCHCCHLGSDLSCKLFHHRLYLVQFPVGISSHHVCHIIGSVG